MNTEDYADELVKAGATADPTPEHLDALAAAFLEGRSRPARDALVLALVVPALRATRRFAKTGLADDVGAETTLAVIECVTKWDGTGGGDGLRRYVEVSARRRAKDWVDDDRAFKAPSRRAREKAAKGEDGRQPLAVAFGPEGPTAPPSLEYLAANLFGGVADPEDEKVLRLKVLGLNAAQIATSLRRSSSWVYRRLQALGAQAVAG